MELKKVGVGWGIASLSVFLYTTYISHHVLISQLQYILDETQSIIMVANLLYYYEY